MTGHIKGIVSNRGCAFIKPDDRSPDYFMHFTDLTNARMEDLAIDMRVLFEPGFDRRGRRCAKAVTVI
jgi:cold shock CspA family protein